MTSMTSIFVNHSARYQVGERVYVLITLPEQQRAAWTEGHIVSEEVWKNTRSTSSLPLIALWSYDSLGAGPHA
ncbi:SubName: Full=Uncharacterized protein {ECO:0000313/EMBL:CCA72042.1} [Serendipita indica DSM 11827]|nr:SubName: Full=Uncharacterized protein {ECO:0000313/EMBL:CCA72042.1} [Serendipita indica DSM 11827]